MALSVVNIDVYGIFVRGAAQSQTKESRRARLKADVAAANRVWKTGFSGGVQCNIQFTDRSVFNYTATETLDVSKYSGNEFPPKAYELIDKTRTNYTGITRAIYVVYGSGERFANGVIGRGGSVGVGGGHYGTIILGSRTAEVNYSFAHNCGHTYGLPDYGVKGNIMYNVVPGNFENAKPTVTLAQCTTARKSKLIKEN